jgi:hypothetical protein
MELLVPSARGSTSTRLESGRRPLERVGRRRSSAIAPAVSGPLAGVRLDAEHDLAARLVEETQNQRQSSATLLLTRPRRL